VSREIRPADPIIRLEGAVENNLKDVTLEVASGRLVCITGVSGSGKSSLIDDCLTAEARRRHGVLSGSLAASLIPYRPKLRSARLPFVVSVAQGTLAWNPRSTVGTATGIWPWLREIIPPFAQVRSRQSGRHLTTPDPDTVAAWCTRWRCGTTAHVLLKLAERVVGSLARWAERAAAVFSGGQVLAPESGQHPNPSQVRAASALRRQSVRSARDIYLVIAGGVRIKPGDTTLQDAVLRASQSALHGERAVLLLHGPEVELLDLSEVLLDPDDEAVYLRPSDVLLSFNSQQPGSGRCPRCDGMGTVEDIDAQQLVSRSDAPIAMGGLALPFDLNTKRYRYFAPLAEEIRGLLVAHSLAANASWEQMSTSARQELMHGSGNRVIQPLSEEGRPRGKRKSFVGLLERVRAVLDGRSAATTVLAHLRQGGPCPECGGSRLRLAARQVYFADRSVAEILKMTFRDLGPWLRGAASSLRRQRVARSLSSIARLAEAADSLGLGHLSLHRDISTLSGGEGQRLRLVEALGSPLHAACYVFDEPTRGLHAADAGHLGVLLRELLGAETTVLLAEHNPTLVATSDEVIEMGPTGGAGGGKVVYRGPPAGAPLLKMATTSNPVPKTRLSRRMILEGVTLRTLRDQTASFALGGITCISGVSGSGKTTLVRDVLVPAVRRYLETQEDRGPGYRRLRFVGPPPSAIQFVNQQAITNNPRSLVLTALGLGEAFRDAFHAGSDAKSLGLTAAHFSTNTAVGQCQTCQGLGTLKPRGVDEAVVCPVCDGSRFNPRVLWAKWQGRSVGNWLQVSLEELAGNERLPQLVRRAADLCTSLGLGHLTLGRSIPTLSGGEAQRLRVATSLLESGQGCGGPGNILFIMDEPAAGLHPADVQRLIAAFRRIVEEGHSLLLIEHNLAVLRASDWLVDLGPGCGSEGGRVLFSGPVCDFLKADVTDSRTLAALRGRIENNNDRPQAALPDCGDTPASRDAVTAFQTYLSRDQEYPNESLPASTRPAYRVHDRPEGREIDDGLALLGLALPLYRLFAWESYVPGQTIYPDQDAAVAAALAELQRKPRSLVGYYPLTQQLASEDVTPEELAAAVRDALDSGAVGWFDGEAVQTRPPAARKRPPDPAAVRVVAARLGDTAESVRRALALGQGCCSVIDPEAGHVTDFAVRALDLKARRAGATRLTPQVFDRGIPGLACRLCDGEGRLTGLDEALILGRSSVTIEDDEFFTKLALACLRGAKRSLMLPALTRLRDSGLIDLLTPRSAFTPEQQAALWWGYPDKLFLKPGGDPDVPRDWHRWRGLVDYILDGLPSAADQKWADKVRNSRTRVACPRCAGTGLGWEACVRHVEGISLLTIRQRFRIMDLERWVTSLSCRSDAGRAAVNELTRRLRLAREVGLGQLPCGLPVSEVSGGDRLLARAVCAFNNALVGAVVVFDPGEAEVGDRGPRLVRMGREAGMTLRRAGEE
jgi:excinuclease ABC A subunit